MAKKIILHRHCFGSLPMKHLNLEHLNLGRCPWNPWFTLSVWRCLGKTFTYKAQDREIVLSCLVLSSIFFQNDYLEMFDPFLKCADGISADWASARMWSIIPKTLLLSAKPRHTSLHDCGSRRRILWWTMRSHSASMLGIHVDPIRRKDSSWCGCGHWRNTVWYYLCLCAARAFQF